MTREIPAQNIATGGIDRRTMLQATAAVGVAAGLAESGSAMAAAAKYGQPKPKGWESDAMRWVQVVLTEDDPARCDPNWWFDFFKNAHIDAINVTAGGTAAFYQTKVPFHTKPSYLAGKDYFGEYVMGCRKLGMAVTARVDFQAVHDDALKAHPEWIMRHTDGSPVHNPIATDLLMACYRSSYRDQYIAPIMKEIGDIYQVDGFFANHASSGLCFCDACKSQFKQASGYDVPASTARVHDPVVRAWILWDRDQRLKMDFQMDAIIRKSNPNAFGHFGGVGDLDPKQVWKTLNAAYADRQGRFGQPAWLNGWNAKNIQCTMPGRAGTGIYNVSESSTPYRFEDSRQSDAELESYVRDGAAQGFRPWMGKFKGEVIDHRWVPGQIKLMNWLWKNEPYFKNTGNFARVAILQSSGTTAFFAPDEAGGGGVGAPRRGGQGNESGYYQALTEARIPFSFADDRLLDPEYINQYRVLVLPNIACMSDKQAGQLRDYVKQGGSIVATCQTALFDEWGQPRKNFALADLFGCDYAGKVLSRVQNSYLTVRGPSPLTARFDDAPRIMAGTTQVQVTPTDHGAPALTLVPSYQNTPMERVYTTTWETSIPAIFARQIGGGRVVYTPHDIDSTYDEISNQDHMWLLQNMVSWALGDDKPVMTVEGPGFIDISYLRQKNSLTAHVVNMNNPMAMKGYYKEILPTGPYKVSIALPQGASVKGVKLLDAGTAVQASQSGGMLTVTIPQIAISEVVAVDLG